MAQRKTLTEGQVAVLRWIAAGCPTGVMEGHFHRISAAALRNRSLVTTSGRGSTWSARITPAGVDYLTAVDGPRPPIPRQGSSSVTQELADRVVAAGGSLRVPRKDWRDASSVDYELRARLANQYGKAPRGKRLTTRYVEGDLEIRLEDAIPGTDVELGPVPVPQAVRRPHPVAGRFRQETARHEVSRAQLRRATRIVHALVVEAERRGHSVTNGNHMVITVRGHDYTLRISEEKVERRGSFDAETERRRSYAYPQYLPARPRKRYDADATGRLEISLDGFGRDGRTSRWRDRQSWTLEQKLPEVLREIEVRAAEDDFREIERRRQAEERQRAWEAAVRVAKERFLEDYRARTLDAQVVAWERAKTAREYLAALEQRFGAEPSTSEWLSWIRTYLDRIDPLESSPTMPQEPEIRPEDLGPFLRGHSPYGPEG